MTIPSILFPGIFASSRGAVSGGGTPQADSEYDGDGAATPFAWDTNYIPTDYTVSGKRVTNNGVADGTKFVVQDTPLSGKKYWEYIFDVGDMNDTYVGVCDGTNRVNYDANTETLMSVGQAVREHTDSFSRVWQDDGTDANGILAAPPMVLNYVVQIAFDTTTGEFWFGVNGVWNGDPEAGTSPALTKGDYGDAYVAMNCRQAGCGGYIMTSAGECRHTPPAGFDYLEGSDDLTALSESLQNGGFETGDLTNWKATGSIAATTSQSWSGGSVSAYEGTYFVYGGGVPRSGIWQTVKVPSSEFADIDAGVMDFVLSWRQNSFGNLDEAEFRVSFLDSNGALISERSSGSASVAGGTWAAQSFEPEIPPSTRFIRVDMALTRVDGTILNAYVDDIQIAYAPNTG